MSFPTWSDLNDESLIPPLGARDAPDIGPVAVMVSTEPDVRYLEANSGKKRSLPFFLGRLSIPENGGFAFVGPYLGAPYAVMILESLIARGANRVVVVGWCGAVAHGLRVGDILIPDAAISDEGTSRNYMEMPEETDFPTLFPSPELSRVLQDTFENSGIVCKTGTLWTTDAIYRETRKKVDFFKHMGAVAVEMECSALFAVAAYRKIDVAAVLIVSDDVSEEEWKPGFKAKQFKASRRKVLDVILDKGLLIDEAE